MLHQLLFGLLLGWGVAIPIGPMNLEIIRRNLRFGTPFGITFGLGACSADVTYLILLSCGALAILSYPLTLKIVGICGSFILAWFGYSALRLKSTSFPQNNPSLTPAPLWRHWVEGYALTLLNPMTILFWSSVSTTVAITTHDTHYATLYTGLGVALGTISWVCGLNLALHFTRHRLSPRLMQNLNYLGGIILLGFALASFWHIFH